MEQEKKLSEVSKLTESDSSVASESQLSASSTDVAPSPTEVNPIANSSNSESKNAALVNKNEDTLVNNCEQQKYVVNYELCLADVHDKENVRRKKMVFGQFVAYHKNESKLRRQINSKQC